MTGLDWTGLCCVMLLLTLGSFEDEWVGWEGAHGVIFVHGKDQVGCNQWR